MNDTTGPAADGPVEPADDDRMRAAVELAERDLAAAGPPPERTPIGTIERLVLALVGAAVLVGFIGSLTPRGAAPVPVWRVGLGWALLVGGVLASVVLLVRGRSEVSRPRRPEALDRLSSAQRRSIRRQLQGKVPIVPAQSPVVLQTARVLAGITPRHRTVMAVIALFAGNATRSDTLGRWVFVGFLVAVWAGGSVFALTYVRRASTFLATHPSPTTEPTP